MRLEQAKNWAVGASIEQAKFEQAQRKIAVQPVQQYLIAQQPQSFIAQQPQQFADTQSRQFMTSAAGVQMVGSTSHSGTATTTQIRPLGCTPTKVPEYTEKDQPGVNEYAFCGEKNLRGSQTLKRTNLHHNYVHDVNHLHNYHNRIKHQARQFNTVVKDCSCIGETEQVQGCACEADP